MMETCPDFQGNIESFTPYDCTQGVVKEVENEQIPIEITDTEKIESEWIIKRSFPYIVLDLTTPVWHKELTITQQFADRVLEQIAARVNRITLSSRWLAENISPPTIACKELTKRICISLYKNYKLTPDFYAASKEEGIYIVYRHEWNGRCFSIEIDNELDCIGQVYDNDNTYVTSSLERDLDFREFMKNFNA